MKSYISSDFTVLFDILETIMHILSNELEDGNISQEIYDICEEQLHKQSPNDDINEALHFLIDDLKNKGFND